MIDKAVLCYVENNFAYFTTKELSDQWGDDWNDAPYEHNAGSPYGPHKDDEPWEILKVAFDGDFETPADIAGHNSSYSVEMINKGAISWLTQRWSETKVSIPAGTTLKQFIELVEKGNGTVYICPNVFNLLYKDHLNEQTQVS